MGRRPAVPPCPRDLETIYACFHDETRRRILNLLIRGPLYVQQIEQALGLRQPLVSRHLAYLRQRGVVQAEREERHRVLYSLPGIRSPELQANLDYLQKCARSFVMYNRDLRELGCGENGAMR